MDKDEILDKIEELIQGKKFIEGYGHMIYAFDLQREIDRLRRSNGEKMSNADRIRQMDDEELANLLEYGSTIGVYPPDCGDNCEDFGEGCAIECPREKRIREKLAWLEEEE